MNGDVTPMDINCALASRYRRDGDGYWSEISVTEPNDTVLRLDGVALEVNWRGDTWISGFEVKVSRGDFLRDAKYLRYKDYVDDLTLVCPARMIDRSEVPEPVGLMYYDPSKRTLRYRRKPDPSHGDTRQVEHRLLKKLAVSDRPDRYGHYETAAEYVAQREAMKGIGRALGTKMALRLQQLEQLQEPTEARRIQAQSKAFEEVCDILNRHGYPINRWTRTENIKTSLKELDESLAHVVPADIVDRETQYAVNCLRQLRITLGIERQADVDFSPA